MSDIDKESALRWFLAGFGVSGEGYNPDVLTDWDDGDHPVRERFEGMWPKPRYEDEVRDSEGVEEFNRKVAEHGLFAALPRIDTAAGAEVRPFDGPRCPECHVKLSINDVRVSGGIMENRRSCWNCDWSGEWYIAGEDEEWHEIDIDVNPDGDVEVKVDGKTVDKWW